MTLMPNLRDAETNNFPKIVRILVRIQGAVKVAY